MSITVSLNPNAHPPVTVSPESYDVSAGTAAAITWVPAAGQTFQFKSLTGLPNPPFLSLNVASTQITVTDNHTASFGPSGQSYPYIIVVESDGTTYSSDGPNPMATGKANIHNR